MTVHVSLSVLSFFLEKKTSLISFFYFGEITVKCVTGQSNFVIMKVSNIILLSQFVSNRNRKRSE